MRQFLGLFCILGFSVFAGPTDTASAPLRGKLVQDAGKPPTLETTAHKRVELSGDEDTMKVLNDARLKNSDFEVVGHYSDPSHFEVDPIHKHALFVYRGGKRLTVSYWCDVCYLRTYSPGKCWCCQKETDLDPQENPER